MTERERYICRTARGVISWNVAMMPVSLRGICAEYGISLLPASSYEKQGLTKDKLFQVWGNPDGIAAVCGPYRIINYNDAVSEHRARFTIAEELFHILLGHTQDRRFNIFAQVYDEGTYQQYEDEAKRAAGMLLLPPSVYFRLCRLYPVREIAKLCNMSEAAAWTAVDYYEPRKAELLEIFDRAPLCDTSKMTQLDRRRAVSVWPRGNESAEL